MACQGRRRRGFSRLSLTGHDGCATPSSWVGASAVACLPSYLSLLLLPCGQGHFGLDFLFAGYVYHGGESERALKTVLVDRYPRDSFTITTKSPVFMIESQQQFFEIFEEQLSRLGTNHVDYYLLHAINRDGYEKVERLELCPRYRRSKPVERRGTSVFLITIRPNCWMQF